MKYQFLIKKLINTFVIVGILTAIVSGALVVSKARAIDTQPPVAPGSTDPSPLAPVISIEPTAIDSVQTDQLVTTPLTITNSGDETLDWMVFDAYVEINWEDNFDSYATDTSLDGVGGWKGWANDPAATAFTRDTFAHSVPNSVEIVNVSDLVHEYTNADSGVWIYTAWQYIPAAFTGESYFILLNQYDDAGVNNNWSVQVDFNGTDNEVQNEGLSLGTLPLIRDQWVELRVEINLDTDETDFYYNDQLLYSGTWTEEVSGGGIPNIAAVDLWGNFSSAVYYDDFSLGQLFDIEWLSTDPTSGTTAPGISSTVDVLLDATGLPNGVYTATLWVDSNDPVSPLIQIPVTMTVLAEADLGITLSDNPDPVDGGAPITYTLTISNTGPDAASGVMVEDTLSGGVTFVSASPGCIESAGVVTCTVGDLASGAMVELTILVNAPSSGGSITNTASVSGDVIDVNPSNDSDSEDTMVISPFYYTYLPIILK